MPVVDLLEAIQINVEHRHGKTLAPRQHHRLVDAVSQQHAVGQVGQGVMVGQVFQLRLQRLFLGDVAGDFGGADDLSLVVAYR